MSRTVRRHLRHSPTPSYKSMASTSTNAPENVSALKAKYTDYALWLKASSKQNREPLFTHELLKHSLCEMGIDTSQAEQLVSTCTWYVYQFHKELETDGEHVDQSTTVTAPVETKKSEKAPKKRRKKSHATKKTKNISPRDHSADSVASVSSIHNENFISPGPPPPTRSKFSILPPIQTSEPHTSIHARHVDFDNEQSNSTEKPKKSHWHSALLKERVLPKLRPTKTDSSIHDQQEFTFDGTLLDNELTNSQKNFYQNNSNNVQTRSILRKQMSTSSSVVSTDIVTRKTRNKILTPQSIIIDEIPLGTKSQRLFGGSECFAQIMNELEQQKLH